MVTFKFTPRQWLVLFLISAAAATLFIIAEDANAQGPSRSPRAPAANAGTAFTYQGQLKKNGALVNGSCSLRFNLYYDAGGTTLVAGPVLGKPDPVTVTNGLFTVQISFGTGAIQGDARWLETSVRCGSDTDYTALSLQELTLAPMALALPGLYTTQNITSPNLIGGFSGNVISDTIVGGAIGGGGSSGYPNRVWDDYAAIAGGSNNTASGSASFIGAGGTNTASGDHTIIGGGVHNTASGDDSAIGGGGFHTASGVESTIGGGCCNIASGYGATIAGGSTNNASGAVAAIGGGIHNRASAESATVPGGEDASASHYGEMAYASGGFYGNLGTAQTSLYVLRNTTATAAWTELFLDGSSERITIAPTRTLSFEILVTARDTSAGQSAGYRMWGVIKNVGGATLMIGSGDQSLGEDDTSWDAVAEADETHDALVVKVKGAASGTVRWVATVRTVEVAN